MTEKEFTTKRFRHSELVIFKSEVKDFPEVECMVWGIDFQNKEIQLYPVDDDFFEPEPFWTLIKNVSFPLPKLKRVK